MINDLEGWSRYNVPNDSEISLASREGCLRQKLVKTLFYTQIIHFCAGFAANTLENLMKLLSSCLVGTRHAKDTARLGRR